MVRADAENSHAARHERRRSSAIPDSPRRATSNAWKSIPTAAWRTRWSTCAASPKAKPWICLEAREHLDQKTCRYVPHILLVPMGGKLNIKSSDPVLHTVQMTGAASNNVPFPFQRHSIPVSLPRNGVVELKCNAGHVWMNANVLVVRHPYYAVTDEHGFFKLTDVPPGEYEIVAWHEGWQIASEAKALDVASQTEVKRPIYSSPSTWVKKVVVKPGADTARELRHLRKARVAAFRWQHGNESRSSRGSTGMKVAAFVAQAILPVRSVGAAVAYTFESECDPL